jgi:hypothetical protein
VRGCAQDRRGKEPSSSRTKASRASRDAARRLPTSWTLEPYEAYNASYEPPRSIESILAEYSPSHTRSVEPWPGTPAKSDRRRRRWTRRIARASASEARSTVRRRGSCDTGRGVECRSEGRSRFLLEVTADRSSCSLYLRLRLQMLVHVVRGAGHAWAVCKPRASCESYVQKEFNNEGVV